MMDPGQSTSRPFRCGYVAIIGAPNVGKSTLMNALVNQKISIVTPKPQTTRHAILGILSTGQYQTIFIDTPGLITPTYMLQKVMMETASRAIADADVIAYMSDAARKSGDAGPNPEESALFAMLLGGRKPVFLVLNKVDLVHKDVLLPMIEVYARAFPFKEIFPISALTRDGTQDLLAAMVSELPEHPPLYPLDIVSEHSERFFVGEIIREKIFEHYEKEIPYSTTVDIVEFKEREGDARGGRPVKWFISADVYVERDSQKAILIGRRGAALKDIGSRARRDIEQFLQHPVFLELHVKVRSDWRNDKNWLTRLGYKPS